MYRVIWRQRSGREYATGAWMRRPGAERERARLYREYPADYRVERMSAFTRGTFGVVVAKYVVMPLIGLAFLAASAGVVVAILAMTR